MAVASTALPKGIFVYKNTSDGRVQLNAAMPAERLIREMMQSKEAKTAEWEATQEFFLFHLQKTTFVIYCRLYLIQEESSVLCTRF